MTVSTNCILMTLRNTDFLYFCINRNRDVSVPTLYK